MYTYDLIKLNLNLSHLSQYFHINSWFCLDRISKYFFYFYSNIRLEIIKILAYVDIKVSDFENVVGAQFTLKYDEEVINYLGVDNFGIATMNIIANFGIPAVENGTISFLWFDSAAQGVTLDDETTLFTVDFKAVVESLRIDQIIHSSK